MVVNTGVAITLLMKKWVDACSLTMKEKVVKCIWGTNRMAVMIVGMTSINLFLAPTFELDMANIAVCLGNFYPGLLGCDLLCGHNKALGMAIIIFSRLD